MDIFCLNDTQESILTISQILAVRKSSICNLEIFFLGRENPLNFHFTNQENLEENYKRLMYAMCTT